MKIDVHVHFDPADTGRKLDQVLTALTALQTGVTTLMAKFDDYVAAQSDVNNKIGNAIDSMVSSLTNINGDVQNLDAQIAALTAQLGSGNLSPAQQQALDDLMAQSTNLMTKMQAVVDAAAALDAITPPPAPPPGP